MSTRLLFLTSATFLTIVANSQAAFLVEVDTDGMDDGVLTFSSNLSFGGNTAGVSQSSESTAFGMTGGDSIFGGQNDRLLASYIVTYNPGSEADNLRIPGGTDLGEHNVATGLRGGGAGTYRVYATWPFTNNVDGGPTSYILDTVGDSFSVEINQNGSSNLRGTAGRGNVWVLLGVFNYLSGDITVTQTPTIGNTAVSMRLAGVLFEFVPEPSAAMLTSLALAGALTIRRWKR